MEFTSSLLSNLDHLGNWGILTTDTDLKIVGWNRWLEKYSGKQASAVVGQHLFEVFPDLIVRSFEHYYRHALEGQAAVLSQRFHKYLLPLPPTVADANLMHMQQTVRISPIMEENQICGTLTLIEDVTERVLAEQELRQQAERLEEANRHKDEFLAMLAHELRNPLAPIRNGVRVLHEVSSESDEAKLTRDMIERQVTHMSRLIDDLLDVSRIVRGKVRLQREACDLSVLLRQIAQDFQPILADNGLILKIDLPVDEVWVEGDAVRLSQIISNLLQNANKFTNQGGSVCLSAMVQHEKQTVVVQVTDNGIGMSKETLARVFDAFIQAESTLARSKGGLGLGLALVKGLTELHGGRVEAQSAGISRGSTFTVHLPLTLSRPVARVAAVPPVRVQNQVQRVLIIEDNRDAAISLKMLLKHLGFEVEIAFSGTEGLEVASQKLPDVILCDIGLPGLDGYAVARALRNNAGTRDTFLIAQSGYGQTDDVRKAHEAGFDLHLIKPVDFQELKRILRSNEPT